MACKVRMRKRPSIVLIFAPCRARCVESTSSRTQSRFDVKVEVPDAALSMLPCKTVFLEKARAQRAIVDPSPPPPILFPSASLPRAPALAARMPPRCSTTILAWGRSTAAASLSFRTATEPLLSAAEAAGRRSGCSPECSARSSSAAASRSRAIDSRAEDAARTTDSGEGGVAEGGADGTGAGAGAGGGATGTPWEGWGTPATGTPATVPGTWAGGAPPGPPTPGGGGAD